MKIKNNFLSIKDGHCYIYLSTINLLILLFLMIMPDNFFEIASIYNSSTPSGIAYKWLDYHFGIIQLIVLLIGICLTVYNKIYSIFALLLYLLFRELLLKNSVFEVGAYEMYLTLFVAISFFLITKYTVKSLEQLNSFFNTFLLLNILTVFVNRIISPVGVDGNRYHASNLDVGGTGMLCSVAILYILEKNEKLRICDYIILFITGIALIMSGSRNSMVFLAIVLILKYMIQFISKKRISKKDMLDKIIKYSIIAIIIIIILIIFSNLIFNMLYSNRIFKTILSGDVASDSSFDGRMQSIVIGIDIIKKNPYGLAGYFINLQRETMKRGFPTFPHSDLICWYLMYGPIILVGYFIIIFKFYKSYINKNRFLWIIVFCLLNTILSGGAETNFKVLFIYILIIFLYINDKKENKQL